MNEERPVFTLDTEPAVLSSPEEAVEVARALGPRLRERVPETEALRRLPDDTVADLLQSGLYGIMKPRRYGGSELGAETLIDVSVELASQCASTGWVYMLWAAHMWLQALWPEAAQDAMWANPNTLASSVVSTSGLVVPEDGGFRWTGRGFFSSGVDHCNWLTAAVSVQMSEGESERRWLLIPREAFEIIDDWFTVGLKGTGSKTVVFDDVFVPSEFALDDEDLKRGTTPGFAVNPAPMYGSISQANFTAAMAAPAIGAARGFLHEYEQKLGAKAANLDRPEVQSPYLPGGLGTSMSRYAAAVAQVDAVHALTLQNASRFSRVPASKVSADDVAKCSRDQAFTAQQSRRVVNVVFEEGGGSGLADGSALQRTWRDTNAAAAHHGLTWDWQGELWPKVVLGLSDFH